MPKGRRAAARPGRTRARTAGASRKTGRSAAPAGRTARRGAKRSSRAAAPRGTSSTAVRPAPPADSELVAAGWQRVRLTLREHGLLLESDAALPNVAALVAGEPVSGSWWSHPASHAIFAVTQRLAAHPDAIAVKLVGGKTTWVHRRLWAPLLALATSGADWQRRGLSTAARALGARLERDGELGASGEPARELQSRLLALGEEVHTESGRHETRLVSWTRWRERGALPPPGLSPDHGQLLLEEALRTLGGEAARARLPWRVQAPGRRSQQAASPRGRRRAHGDAR